MSAHAGQLDRDGYPLILHPLTVGLMGYTDEEKMAGFHPQQVSYESLCKLFFGIHDPEQTDGVGPDLGHNTAAVSSIVMNLRSRQPNM